MRHARFLRGGLGGLILALTIPSTGCIRNYYGYGYNSNNPCAPVQQTLIPGFVAQPRAVCDVPTQVVGGSAIVGTSPLRSNPSMITSRPPRVVMSEAGQNGRFPWRASDPERSLATTRVEGAIDDPTVIK